MRIATTEFSTQEIESSQLIKDMRAQKRHLPKIIMDEVYRFITMNPRQVTLRLYLHYNYPAYDNDIDCDLIWELCFMSKEYVSDLVFNNH